MARPLRIEFAGALYHVTSRGDGREDIYTGDHDREVWLEILGQVSERFNWTIHAYCQMGNHYHLLVETPDGNLAKGMRQLNGVYTQRFNQTPQPGRSRLSGSLQGHPGAERGLPAGALPLCRAQPGTCPHGANGTRLGVEQLPGHGRYGARARMVGDRLDTGRVRGNACRTRNPRTVGSSQTARTNPLHGNSSRTRSTLARSRLWKRCNGESAPIGA